MKSKLNFETLIYAAVVLLCLFTALLIAASADLFSGIKIVYGGF